MVIISDNGLRGLYMSDDFYCFDGFRYYTNMYAQNIEQCAYEVEEIIKSIKRGDPKRNKIKKFLINKNSSKQK